MTSQSFYIHTHKECDACVAEGRELASRYTLDQLKELARDEYGAYERAPEDDGAEIFLDWLERRESPKPGPIVKPLLKVRGKKDA